LGTRPDKRRERKPRKISGAGEVLFDGMENSILGNPIEENTLTI